MTYRNKFKPNAMLKAFASQSAVLSKRRHQLVWWTYNCSRLASN